MDYHQTSFKWLVQFASYVVLKLKDQVYDTIQGGYEGIITKDEIDVVWDADQPSEIYEFALKRDLAEIVGEINSYIPPMVDTTVGEPDGEATADGSSEPQEPVTPVSHVRTSKPKAQRRRPKRFTIEEVLTLIVSF